MKIALLTLGTRGDVQPYAVLGRALKLKGHTVTLSTGKNFEALANDYGVDFVPVEADFQALINSDEGKAMMKNPFLARKHFKNVVRPMMIDAMRIFYNVAKGNDAVLYHVKALGDFFADQFPGKMMRANVIPAIQPTAEFPNPVFSALQLPAFLNRFTYTLADLGLAMMNGAIHQFRLNASLSPAIPKRIDLPSVYGVSPRFLNKPADYPADSHFTGFWYGSSPLALDQSIVNFIESGRQTVLVTFGSMPFETKFNLRDALMKLSTVLHVNVLVVKGWGFENDRSFSDSEHVMLINHAPFDKLFPKVNAVVHHGGIGTVAECLRAGVPFLSCPVIYPMGDQHFWAKRSYDIGVSVKPIPLKKMTQAALIQSVQSLLSNAHFAKQATSMATILRTEDGISNAIAVIESHFKP